MKLITPLPRCAVALMASLGLMLPCVKAQVLYHTPGSTYTEDFDTLAITSSPWQDNTTLAGWYAYMATSGIPDTYRPNEGGKGSSGGLMSYYVNGATSSNRALGYQPGTAFGHTMVAIRLTNQTGLTLDTMTIDYRGELWRIIGTGDKSLQVAYQIGSPETLMAGEWTAIPALTFQVPATEPGGTALNGHLPENSALLSATIAGFEWKPGMDLYIRFFQTNDIHNKGLAIDDFSFTATAAIPEPATAGLVIPGLLALTGWGWLRSRSGGYRR